MKAVEALSLLRCSLLHPCVGVLPKIGELEQSNLLGVEDDFNDLSAIFITQCRDNGGIYSPYFGLSICYGKRFQTISQKIYEIINILLGS